MKTFAQSPEFLNHLDGEVHSSVRQVPDDEFVGMANSIVNVALAPETQTPNRPAELSSTTPHRSNANSNKSSQTVVQMSAKRVAPLVSRWHPHMTKPRKRRTLTPIAEFEGYVEYITEDKFSVRMVDVRSNSPLPVDHADFRKLDICEYDQHLLKEGAIVRWVIGRERLHTGQVRNVSELYFRRLPAHSERDYKRAYKKAEALVEAIVWEDEAAIERD